MGYADNDVQAFRAFRAVFESVFDDFYSRFGAEFVDNVVCRAKTHEFKMTFKGTTLLHYRTTPFLLSWVRSGRLH